MGMGFAYITPNIKIAEEIVKLINNREENKAQVAGEVSESAKSKKDLVTILHKPYEGKSLEFLSYAV